MAETKKEGKNPQQEFINEYNALCDKYKLQIASYPEFEFSQDTKRYGIVVKQTLIEKK